MPLRDENEQTWSMGEWPLNMTGRDAPYEGVVGQRGPLNGLCLWKPLPLDSQRFLIMRGNTVAIGNGI